MHDFNTPDEYETYIHNLSLTELRGIQNKLDKYKYPDRYDLVCSLIRKKEVSHINGAWNEKKYYPPGVLLIRNIQIALLICGFIGLILKLLVQSNGISPALILQFILGFSAIAFIVYGINNSRQWVWLLVLINAYISFIWAFMDMLYLTRSAAPENDKIIMSILFILFIIYQIYVFSKSETKLYFKAKNNIII